MIARITKLLLALQALVAAGLFIAIKITYASPTWVALAAGVGAVFLLRFLITANNFFVAWLYGSETPSAYRINFFQTIELFIHEFKATILTSSWSMPFRSFKRRINKKTAALPVLLVHGYVCNSGQWDAMSKCLMKAEITHYAVDLEPVFGSIESYVPIIHHAVETICKETGQDKIIVVAHSMGGLAARAYLRAHGTTHIAKVITMGTPHHGTALAGFGKGVNSAQMHWNGNSKSGTPSDWLLQLAKEENQKDYTVFVSLYSYHDNIIAPQCSSYLAGARNIAFRGIGHVALLFDVAVQNTIIEEIRNTPKT